MRKWILMLVLFGVGANVSWANIYEGVIADTFDGGQSIKVTHVDALTKEKKSLSVSLDPQTKILGADSVSALKPGDAVSINAVELGDNRLSAKSITPVCSGCSWRTWPDD